MPWWHDCVSTHFADANTLGIGTFRKAEISRKIQGFRAVNKLKLERPTLDKKKLTSV